MYCSMQSTTNHYFTKIGDSAVFLTALHGLAYMLVFGQV
jgi:hypothetical protein